MRKILTCLLAFVLLIGCSVEDSQYIGSYGLVVRDGYTYLVAYWEYPDEKNYDINTHQIDISNFSDYIDNSIDHKGKGLELGKIQGAFGFTKRFLKIEPIHMHEEDVKKASRRKIQLTIEDDEGNSYQVTLKYNEDIKYVE